jgi:hypothetical protein
MKLACSVRESSDDVLKVAYIQEFFNCLNAKLNPICHLLALVGAHHILHISRVRANTNYRYN